MNSNWLLVTPPVGDCTMPLLGPLVLSQALKDNGLRSRCYDASLDMFWMALDEDVVRDALTYSRASEERQRSAFAVLGRTRRKKHGDRIKRLELAAEILSQISPGVKFSLDEITFEFSTENFRGLKRAVERIAWLSVFYGRMKVIRGISDARVTHVGISVSYSSQLAPALVLIRYLRRLYPRLNLCLGGAYFGNGSLDERQLLRRFPDADAIIIGPGESILQSVANEMHHLTGVIKGTATVKGYIPDLTHVRWTRYCAGKNDRIIPFSFRKPCYYGRCSFCGGDRDDGCRGWSSQEVVDLTRRLLAVCVERRITGIYFADAALPSFVLRILAREIRGRVKWGCNVRIERGWTHARFEELVRGGCKMLRVGLESASQRVLDQMNKGTSVKDILPYLRNATMAGIRMHVYVMFGFPGEDEEDRQSTADFLRKAARYVYSYSISIFHSIPGTAIHVKLLKQFGYDLTADVDVNHHYYTEQRYANVLQWAERAQNILSGVHTNRYCYSGRIFMEEPDLGVSRSVWQNVTNSVRGRMHD